MSEERKPTIVLNEILPLISGRISLKIEAYRADQWSEKFHTSSPTRKNCQFFGSVDGSSVVPYTPRRSMDANRFFRLRVNGKWYSKYGKQYEFYPKSHAYRLLEQLSKSMNRQQI